MKPPRPRHDEEESTWPTTEYQVSIGSVGQMVEYAKAKKLKKRRFPFGFAIKEEDEAPSE